MPRLDEVFKKSGFPTHTFVEPEEFSRVLTAIRTPGRCIIIEGPSGIGKTSCIKKALDDLGIADSCLSLSARKNGDLELIRELPNMKDIGVVVVDDFHRLDDAAKQALTDYVKVLADEEDEGSKVILIGINRAGQSLVDYAPDLLHRVETIRVGRTNIERVQALIEQGQRALKCTFSIAEEIAAEAEGSFAIAQVLCHETAVQGKVLETAPELVKVKASLPSVREAVLGELSPRFFPVARDFATGNKLRKEGRAPYLHLLKWLSATPEGALDTKEAIAGNPELKGSVSQVIDKGHLNTLIGSAEAIEDLMHFDPTSEMLTTEDPKFLYFLRHLIWSKFARQVGYYSIEFGSRYDFALSFAGEDRELAEALFNALSEREITVFYDKNEQQRILANDVEGYLAPIYRSESRFVVALLSGHYPKKIWTKFESEQFKERFGDSVVPIWFADAPPGMFDESRRVGGLEYNPEQPMDAQLASIVSILCEKLAEDRKVETKIAADD